MHLTLTVSLTWTLFLVSTRGTLVYARSLYFRMAGGSPLGESMQKEANAPQQNCVLDVFKAALRLHCTHPLCPIFLLLKSRQHAEPAQIKETGTMESVPQDTDQGGAKLPETGSEGSSLDEERNQVHE